MRSMIAAIIVAALPTSAVAAVPQCMDYSGLIDGLARQYQESKESSGLMADGRALVIMRSADGGTWTAIVTQPSGYACIVATGENWRGAEWLAPGAGT